MMFGRAKSSDYENPETPVTALDDEIDRYLNLKEKSENLLLFWRSNEHNFPFLSKNALKTLVIQASSALSERIFTYAGKNSDRERSSLKLETLSSLTRLMSGKLNNIYK